MYVRKYKVCSRCGEKKPIKKFQKRTNAWDGLAPYCKRCAKKIYHLNKRNTLRKPNALVLYEILRDYGMDRVTSVDEVVWWKYIYITNSPRYTDPYKNIMSLMNSYTGQQLFERVKLEGNPKQEDGRSVVCIKITDNKEAIEKISRKYNRK